MEKLEIKVSRRTRMVELPRQFISVDGENLQSKLVFTFVDEFVDGQARLEYEIKGNKNYMLLDKESETYTIPVKNVLTKEGQIDMQLVITEGTDDEEIPVFKSNKFYLFCNSSINAVAEAPDGYELWIEQANIKLNEIDNLNIELKDSILTITRKDGTTYSENVKGEPGVQGKPGSVKTIAVNEFPTENIEEDAIYILPNPTPTSEKDKYQEFVYVNGGWELFGGGSVGVDLADYVKNTDYPTSSNSGVVKVNPTDYGVGAYPTTGYLYIVPATKEQIDKKTHARRPIAPSNLDYAVGSVLPVMTQAEYDALETKNENLYYFIVEE